MSTDATHGTTFKMTLTGGATYDPVPLPSKSVIRKLTLKSIAGLGFSYKYKLTDDPATLLPLDILDLKRIAYGPGATLYVNDTAADVLDGEYWV